LEKDNRKRDLFEEYFEIALDFVKYYYYSDFQQLLILSSLNYLYLNYIDWFVVVILYRFGRFEIEN